MYFSNTKCDYTDEYLGGMMGYPLSYELEVGFTPRRALHKVEHGIPTVQSKENAPSSRMEVEQVNDLYGRELMRWGKG